MCIELSFGGGRVIAQGSGRKCPGGSRGEPRYGGLWDEVVQKLKQFADIVYRF